MNKYNLWAEINLNSLQNNIKNIRKYTGNSTEIIGIVKSNAYGHGAIEIAKELVANDIKLLAVASLEEAMELRYNKIDEDILILGYTNKLQLKSIVEESLIKTIYSLEEAIYLNKLALRENKRVRVHIKLDIGMARLGFSLSEKSLLEIKKISKFKGLIIDGVFSHFPLADSDIVVSRYQYKNFLKFIEKLRESINIPKIHLSNSGAVLNIPEANFDLIRPGILIYGYFPSKFSNYNLNLKPLMSLKTRVSFIKELEKNKGISYGYSYYTKKKMKIASLSVGYGDGYPRSLSNQGEVIIKGKRCKILGKICMDQMMVDVSHIDNIEVGDTAILFGSELGENLGLDEVATRSGLSEYEILSNLGRRIVRIYKKNDREIKEVNYLRF